MVNKERKQVVTLKKTSLSWKITVHMVKQWKT